MKLISWNVNGIRAAFNKGFMDFLAEYQPDVIGLQEVKGQREKVEAEIAAIEQAGYHVVWNAAQRPGYSGTAVLSRQKPLSVRHDIDTSADNEGRVVAAEFEKFWFVTVYTPNAKEDLSRLEYRQEWDEKFLEFVRSLEKTKPVVFCGDLNVAHQEIDLARPDSNRGHHGFTDEERSGFDKIVEAGFIDTFRKLYPDRHDGYSWWSYFGGARARNVGWRIDYFAVSGSLRDKLKDAHILAHIMGSDHCPVSLEIDI